jgi:diguanylate cyclase (GGDEF)-like protein
METLYVFAAMLSTFVMCFGGDFRFPQVVGGVVNLFAIWAYHRKSRRSLASANAMATTDTLTNLPNRRGLMLQLAHDRGHAQRTDEPLSVLYLDLNNFKLVNDKLGHKAGDSVLSEIAARLNRALRVSDTAARVGGDEFVVVLLGTIPDGVQRVVSKLRSDLRLEVGNGADKILVSPAIGIAHWQNAETIEQLLQRADEEMYRDKKILKAIKV